MNRKEILNILNKAAALQNKLIKKIAGKLLTSCYLLVNKSNNTVEYISTSEQDLNTHAGDNDLNPEDYKILKISLNQRLDNLKEFKKLNPIKVEQDEPYYMDEEGTRQPYTSMDDILDQLKKR